MTKINRFTPEFRASIFMCDNSHTKRRNQMECTHNDVIAYNKNQEGGKL
jgi:hypothetical protein